MRYLLTIAQIAFFFLLLTGAKTQYISKNNGLSPEIKLLDLKFKKELSDKKLSPQRKYALAVLAARDFKQLSHKEKAIEYYKIAYDIKVEENKNEILMALSRKSNEHSSLFFYEVNLKALIKNKFYEKALLSMDPGKLSVKENTQYRIIYDLLNVKMRKTTVKKLYCLDEYQKNPEVYQYSNLLCDMLNDYLREGKVATYHIKLLDEYFFKHDLKERYLLQVAKDIKNQVFP